MKKLYLIILIVVILLSLSLTNVFAYTPIEFNEYSNLPSFVYVASDYTDTTKVSDSLTNSFDLTDDKKIELLDYYNTSNTTTYTIEEMYIYVFETVSIMYNSVGLYSIAAEYKNWYLMTDTIISETDYDIYTGANINSGMYNATFDYVDLAYTSSSYVFSSDSANMFIVESPLGDWVNHDVRSSLTLIDGPFSLIYTTSMLVDFLTSTIDFIINTFPLNLFIVIGLLYLALSMLMDAKRKVK